MGGSAGLGLGVAGVYLAGVRYPAFRQLTLPLRAFLITSSATFGGEKAASCPDKRQWEEVKSMALDRMKYIESTRLWIKQATHHVRTLL